MSVPDILNAIGERFQSSATVRNVYGEPVQVGDRTVIPVARISYAFGAGGGSREGEPSESRPVQQGRGGGGGGRVSAAPAGVIEITALGTHFVPSVNWSRVALLASVSFALGVVLGSRKR